MPLTPIHIDINFFSLKFDTWYWHRWHPFDAMPMNIKKKVKGKKWSRKKETKVTETRIDTDSLKRVPNSRKHYLTSLEIIVFHKALSNVYSVLEMEYTVHAEEIFVSNVIKNSKINFNLIGFSRDYSKVLLVRKWDHVRCESFFLFFNRKYHIQQWDFIMIILKVFSSREKKSFSSFCLKWLWRRTPLRGKSLIQFI